MDALPMTTTGKVQWRARLNCGKKSVSAAFPSGLGTPA